MIIPTYPCNAARSKCCFESNPSIRHRMTRDELFATIRKAYAEFPGLRVPDAAAHIKVLTRIAEHVGDRAFARQLASRPATALVSKYTDLAERTFHRR